MRPIIIIGSGLSAYTLSREFRKLDKTTPLMLITADHGGFYSKPMLSNAFALGKQADQLITQTATQMAAQINATILTNTRVSNIDSATKTVGTSAGTFEYDKLLIAVGAQAIRLAIAGDAADSVLSINHIDDYLNFRSTLAQKSETTKARVTILGAGLIGCEFADDLAGAGHAVTLVDPNPLPLAALAAPALSRGLHAALSARGITLELGTTAASIDYCVDALNVTLANGNAFETDIVLSAVGLRPDLRLAQAAHLSTNRGIIVDTTGRTSAPDIYALGDCAEYTIAADGATGILPYIAPLMTAARAIARTLAGDRSTIDLKAAPVLVKTPSYPLALVPPPSPTVATGYWHDDMDEGRTVSRFYDALGVMQGFGVVRHDASVRQRLLAALGTIAMRPLVVA